MASPKALALALSRTPATARELDGARLADTLFDVMKAEEEGVRVRSQTTHAVSKAVIPVAWEEVLAIFATEQCDTAEWISRLKSDLLLLEGQVPAPAPPTPDLSLRRPRLRFPSRPCSCSCSCSRLLSMPTRTSGRTRTQLHNTTSNQTKQHRTATQRTQADVEPHHTAPHRTAPHHATTHPRRC